ncbi:hypothetical protein AUEXF2481DRAFT_30247 [Aureobasidium subglaciale EXF-2481]|uniref:Mid2 domain-containing protein n=1 Tax=Aureobasidium subglaciale (strain EXF-2481) TaxID=1043005 RepID=A0A074Y942_AURSE|nr:uncharacterized protein AUEXF2481DRAFT_30247 [Aureobasidium subglaciale EXF-2481]KAI5209634.1 hypothetical protein E4T38_02163 [Aureobasidium subglaciale]KAI5228541.1 hypothetical protein E4T40_01942 [Aureobasidium subglaciale]KAI5231929.1 hypothetical protein E4T41_02162 [Aureobasidium subglaciale]KAI5265861.1 hypothetical protein E4T46_01940 [Aureobasidium subglaciale]KEQ94265.1 hypothetical protein AUEXF2481DRAFT_30247 [Aureobasidium subglaciale EXF-2481]
MRSPRRDLITSSPSLLRLAVIALTISPTLANPLIPKELGIGGLSLNSLFGRGSCETPCGWSGQLCCTGGESCYTDASNQAQCASTTAPAKSETTGYWKYWTSTWIETDTVTRYSTGSSWCGDATSTAAVVGGGGAATSVWVAPSSVAASPTASVTCNWDSGQSSCGNICCASDQYCLTSGQCAAAAGAGTSKHSSGSSTGISPAIRPTSSTLVIVTATSSPTTTVPFLAPVATGANVTLTGAEASNSHGLSGGAIAGIVIGVIAGLLLLSLLCLFCCARGIWVLLFGGRKKRRTERTEVIESHHHRAYSGAGGAAYAGSRPDERRWPGSQAPRKEKGRSKFTEMLGIGAALGGLAAVLGLKRKHDRRRDEKSDYSSAFTDATYSDYYTSENYIEPNTDPINRQCKLRRQTYERWRHETPVTPQMNEIDTTNMGL